MPWINGELRVYHGTDNISANAIRLSGINASLFRARTDFGKGFYTTTSLHQAKQWSNQRCRKGKLSSEVLVYDIPRTSLTAATHLAFVTDTSDYYDFVTHCRSGAPFHGSSIHGPPTFVYDIVYGPVSLWRQYLVIANCDQIMIRDPSMFSCFTVPTNSITAAPARLF